MIRRQQPYVTGVGGTRLTAIGPPPTETVWNDGVAGGAGGGGVSLESGRCPAIRQRHRRGSM